MVGRHLVTLMCLWAASVCAAQVSDGQQVVRAALGDDYVVWELMATGSMKPALDETYYLLIKQLPWEGIEVGDRIMYESKLSYWIDGRAHHLVVHAVIARSSSGSVLVTQGYANSRPDSELITKSMYRGTVVGSVKKPRVFP